MTKRELAYYLSVEVYRKQEAGWLKKWYIRFREPSYEAVWLVRKFQYYASNGKKWRSYRIRNALVQKYGIFIHPNTRIGEGLKLPHPDGIILGRSVTIGKDCTIFQQVTLGSKNCEDCRQGMQPTVGDGCTLFAGCKVIGGVTLQNGTQVGANAVLMCNTEENSVYAGIPAVRCK